MSNNSDDFLKYWAGMHFEARQAAWDGTFVRSFRQLHGRSDRPSVWECWVVGDRYFTRHGLLGGKQQETSKRGKLKNPGKVNELSPELDAMAEARRLCRKKWDFEGYDEFVGDVNVDNRGKQSIPHMLSSLPGSFCLYKPQNNILTCKGLCKRLAAGGAIFTLKRNGMAHWLVKDHAGNLTLYSRRNRPCHKDEGPKEMDDGTMDYSQSIPWSSRYPHLMQAFAAMNMPNNSMLAIELVHPDGDTKSHFAHVQSVTKSLTPQALKDQQDKGWLVAYIWDSPFWGGVDCVSTISTFRRQGMTRDRVNELPKWAQDWIRPLEVFTFPSLDESIEYAKNHQLEGWVVVDKDGVYGDKGWNLKGKPDRPSICAKAKPWLEDDFIAMWDPSKKVGTLGKGRHEKGKLVVLPNGESVKHGGVGSVGLHQYNSDGDLIYICDCSSGMDYDMQANLTPKSFPMVWEVQFVERSYISDGDKTNALTFPKLVRVRTDKTPEECINDEL